MLVEGVAVSQQILRIRRGKLLALAAQVVEVLVLQVALPQQVAL
jgi:hypothetical protein